MRSFWRRQKMDFEPLYGWLMLRAAQEAVTKLNTNSKALRNPLLPPTLHPIALVAHSTRIPSGHEII